MNESAFSSLRSFLRDLTSGAKSVLRACRVTLPYLFSAGEHSKEITEQYPDPISSKTPDDMPPRSRGLLFNDIDRCTGCKNCQQICPTDCFKIETEPGTDPGKTWVAVFDIDFSRCIFCGLCVEACEPQSLIHTKQYEGAVHKLPDLVASFGKGYVTPQQRAKWAAIRKAREEDEGGFFG